MRIKDAEFYIRQKQFLQKLDEERKKRPGTGDGTRAMPVRNVEFYICQEWDFQQWLMTPEAKCVAHKELESLYRQKWDAGREELPEPLVQKALRNAAKKSGEVSRESACSLYLNVFDHFMC